MSGSPAVSTVRLGDIVDRLDTPDGSAVLVGTTTGHRVARLSVIGTTVVDVLGEARAALSLEELTRALVERLGPPDGMDPVRTVEQAIEALAVEHVVVAEL